MTVARRLHDSHTIRPHDGRATDQCPSRGPRRPPRSSRAAGIFEVLATGGNTRLGGEDFDAQTVDWLWAQFLKTHKGATLSGRAKRRLFVAAERAKRQLSAATTTDVDVESFHDGEHLKVQLTRAKFEQLNRAPPRLAIVTRL